MIVNVYTPTPGSLSCASIHEGSGIVGTPLGGSGRVLIDFEGNLYGAENMRTYEERLLHAADRHRTRYPTMARMAVRVAELHLVGTYDTDTRTLLVTDEAALAAWRDA